MSLKTGQCLGAFEILAPLGAGGMGEVYRAHDSNLDRDVAIKVLPDHLVEAPDHLARFEREARLLASLGHANIGVLYDLKNEESRSYLVMELIDGETLAERIAQCALAVPEALAIAVEIAAGLEAAHTQGVVHRDLKPSNIMLARNGGVKLLDFGLGKMLDDDPVEGSAATQSIQQQLTSPGAALGTTPYMSPEQVRGQRVGRRADIWAFGCVLYEMLTGERAFPGETRSDSIAAVLGRDPDWSRLPRQTPSAVSALLRRCLRKDQQQRLRNIADGRLEIEQAMAEPADDGSSTAGTPPLRFRMIHASTTALLILLLAIAAFQVIRTGREPAADPAVVRFQVPAPSGSTFQLDPEIPGPAVISPDGSMVAFSARIAGGEVLLYLRSLDDIDARPLAGTDNAYFPFWSPDSTSIGFFAGGKLLKVKVSGGAPVILCDAPSGRGGSWGPGGVIVFAPNSNSALHRVADAGGAATPVTVLDADRPFQSHRFPHFLPSGSRFLFLATSSALESSRNTIFVSGIDGGAKTELLTTGYQAGYASGHLLFIQKGRRTLMAQPFDPERLQLSGEAVPVAKNLRLDPDVGHAVYSASRTGTLAFLTVVGRAGSKLVWLDRDGSQIGEMAEVQPFIEVTMAPTGSRAAVSVSESGRTDIWIYDLPSGNRSRFTFGGTSWLPLWSPSGHEIVYSSLEQDRVVLYRKAVVGSGEATVLLESEANKFAEGWSPDGSSLAFNQNVSGTWDVWIFPLDGDRVPYPIVQSPYEDAGGVFSPDGRWLTYHSTESGRWEVYVTPFPGPGRKWQISPGGGAWAIWRQDGREIFYHGVDGHLMAVEVEGSQDQIVVGAARELFKISEFGHFKTFAPAPDGQKFLTLRRSADQHTVPLTVVLNWTVLLDED